LILAFSTAAAIQPQIRKNLQAEEVEEELVRPLMAMAPSFGAVRDERVPAREPTGVLATATM